jgi:hypothetical protein
VVSRLRNRREQERLEGCFGIVVVSRATREVIGSSAGLVPTNALAVIVVLLARCRLILTNRTDLDYIRFAGHPPRIVGILCNGLRRL